MPRRSPVDKSFSAELLAAAQEVGAIAGLLRSTQRRLNSAGTWKTMHPDRQEEMKRQVGHLRSKLRGIEETLEIILHYNPPASTPAGKR